MAAIPSHPASRRRLSLALTCVAAVVLITAAEKDHNELVSREVFLMGTAAVLSTWSESRQAGLSRLEGLLRALEETEQQLSTWREDSEISRLNASAGNGPFMLSPVLCRLIADLDQWTRDTRRAFDPAIGTLAAAWDLHGNGRIPSVEVLAAAHKASGWHRLTLRERPCTVELPRGLSLDVGGFGKGEALDRARALADPASAWLIDLGGQVAVAGTPPGASGWTVSLAHPQRRDTPALQLQLTAGSLATSGGSERDLRAGARRLGHILDPHTGEPALFAGTVTVWHEQALAADVLSTALFVMGPEKGLQFANSRGIAAVYLLPDANGGVVTRPSQAFSARFH